jgi:membrane-associated phospholipid phosphatase
MGEPTPRNSGNFRRRLVLTLPPLAVSVFTFTLLAVQIRQQRPPSWDGELLRFLAEHGRAQPLRSMLDTSLNIVGVYRGLVPAGLLVLGLIVSGRRRAGLLSMLILGASIATVVVLKPVFHRPPLIAGREGYFPSTHAAGSFAAGAVLLFLAWPTRWRWPMLTVSFAFVSLYSASLVYSRAHYPSDVVAGWCIALFWATGVALLVPSDDAARKLGASGTSASSCADPEPEGERAFARWPRGTSELSEWSPR